MWMTIQAEGHSYITNVSVLDMNSKGVWAFNQGFGSSKMEPTDPIEIIISDPQERIIAERIKAMCATYGFKNFTITENFVKKATKEPK